MTPRVGHTHACPGGCGTQVPYHLLACKPDWRRLPAALKAAVNEGYRQRLTNPGAHRAAIADASDWFRDNPAQVSL